MTRIDVATDVLVVGPARAVGPDAGVDLGTVLDDLVAGAAQPGGVAAAGARAALLLAAEVCVIWIRDPAHPSRLGLAAATGVAPDGTTLSPLPGVPPGLTLAPEELARLGDVLLDLTQTPPPAAPPFLRPALDALHVSGPLGSVVVTPVGGVAGPDAVLLAGRRAGSPCFGDATLRSLHLLARQIGLVREAACGPVTTSVTAAPEPVGDTVSALMEALDSSAAVLDADGLVVAGNRRWEAAAGTDGSCACGPVPQGTNWLNALERGRGRALATFAQDVAEVLRGERDVARTECRCPGAAGGSLAAEVVRLHGEDAGAVVVLADLGWRRRLEDELSHRALHDDLTGLPNRAALIERLAGSLRRLDGDHLLAVLFCDLDGFKDINDGLGHDVGDQVLVAVAGRLRQRCRSADVVARFGGDEFVVVLPVPDVSRAVVMAERLVEVLGEPIVVGDAEVAPGASIGITVVDRAPDGDDPVGTLLRDADTAMYHAKERGRGRFEFFDAGLRTDIEKRLELASALRRADMDREFELRYQTRRYCGTRNVSGVEALLTWRHPLLGDVGPAGFVPVAERTGRIVEVGAWVLRRAMEEVAAQADRSLGVAVNVSPRQLAAPRFVETVARSLEDSGLEAERLVLEITEGALVDDPAAARQVLLGLRRLGVSVALDDFGTGWSSMSYLRTLPVDVLKVDRSFVADLATDPDACAVVSAVLNLGHGMGLVVVAEGVERLDQLEVLRDMGCDEYQGFIDGVPGPLPSVLSSAPGGVAAEPSPGALPSRT